MRKISRTSAEGRLKVRGLRKSSNIHRIGKGVENRVSAADRNGRKGTGSGSKKGAYPNGLATDRSLGQTVGTGEGTGSIMEINTNNSIKGGNTLSTVAHEMQHSVDMDNGEFNPNRMAPIGDDSGRPDGEGGVKTSEYRAVQFENHIRANNNLKPRDNFNEDEQGVRTNLINKNQDYKKSSGLEL